PLRGGGAVRRARRDRDAAARRRAPRPATGPRRLAARRHADRAPVHRRRRRADGPRLQQPRAGRHRVLPGLQQGEAARAGRDAARRARRLLGRRGLTELAKELLVVTGKGGVGKSTVAAAVGLVAARRGLRTIVAEVAARDDVTRALEAERPDRYLEYEIAPGLHHISIDPEAALEEYLRDQLPTPLAEVLAQSRMFTV